VRFPYTREGPSWSIVCTTICSISAYHHTSCWEFEPRSWRGDLVTTLCNKICQWLATGRDFSPGTPVSSTNQTDRHDITEILLKVVLNTINQPCTTELLFIIQFEEMHKTIFLVKYEIVFIYYYSSTHIPMAAVSKLS
jgi:hypothetical protein